jgi:Coenzyme PQQ synthesis protein D (PqqD)
MPISFNHRVAVSADVLVRELDGEAVLLNLNNESYYGLDDVGTRMWTLLTTTPTIAAAYDHLLAEYAVTPDQLRGDMESLLSELVGNGLLQVTDGTVA